MLRRPGLLLRRRRLRRRRWLQLQSCAGDCERFVSVVVLVVGKERAAAGGEEAACRLLLAHRRLEQLLSQPVRVRRVARAQPRQQLPRGASLRVAAVLKLELELDLLRQLELQAQHALLNLLRRGAHRPLLLRALPLLRLCLVHAFFAPCSYALCSAKR